MPKDASQLPLSDDALQRRTGRGWDAWFELLDAGVGGQRSHADMAAWLQREQGVDAWSAQSIVVGYERAHLGRAAGQRPDGFQVSASKTIAADAATAFSVLMDERSRPAWLGDDRLRLRTATAPKTARFDWGDGPTRVIVGLVPKGDRCAVTITHERLPGATETQRMRAFWRERLVAFQALAEGRVASG